MTIYYRKTVYLCRAPWCKHKNQVWQKVDEDDNVVETAPAWQGICGKCGRSSLDLVYQKVFKPKPKLISPSAVRDDADYGFSHPTIKEYEDAQEY